ncbi:hypothetical protein BFW01_g2925 [Lasiodiplodia theobromae]|nr:hypothetical protein BFW01_g2925 [Lasiodiplodia theobromae]
MTIITTQNNNSNEQNVFTNEQWASQQQRSAIRQVLKTNRVDSSRSMQASLNEFRHWTPSEVSALFASDDYPALKDRKLCPLGPEMRYPPPGARRWGELAAKMAVVGVADAALFATSRLYSALPAKYQNQWTETIKESGYQGSAQDQFDEAGRAMRQLRGEMVATSTFVSAPLRLVEQAADSRQALCVNRKGEFRVMSEGYAAISHVWGETMGLEHGGEKIKQDGRGMLRRHFDRLMEPALRCGYEWLWLDLLAIPKRSTVSPNAPAGHDDGGYLTRLKTRVINTLDAVYRNAAAVIVLDSFPLLYRGADPAQAAALLVCGPWLTRVWTYQEIKLARRALLATSSSPQGFIDFATIRAHLSQLAAHDPRHWEQLHKTFWRLQSVHAITDGRTTELGINLADIALSCTNRTTNNEKDYARGFFALLRLQWDPDWSSYDDGIRHVYERRPREAAVVAAMHGPRGLASPWSWAPRFLVGLQGRVNLPDEFFCDAAGGGLRGWWHEVPVTRFGRWRAWCVPGEEQQQVAMLIGVRDAAGCEREVHVLLADAERARVRDVEGWVELIATGRAVMLAASEMAVSPDCVFPTVLLALRDDSGGGKARDVDELKAGHVVFSGVLVDAGREGLDASLGQWVLR